MTDTNLAHSHPRTLAYMYRYFGCLACLKLKRTVYFSTLWSQLLITIMYPFVSQRVTHKTCMGQQLYVSHRVTPGESWRMAIMHRGVTPQSRS